MCLRLQSAEHGAISGSTQHYNPATFFLTPEGDSTSHIPSETACSTENTSISDITVYLAHCDLITSGLGKFDDWPENEWSWKSTFMNVIKGLKLPNSKQLDLIVEWLGPK